MVSDGLKLTSAGLALRKIGRVHSADFFRRYLKCQRRARVEATSEQLMRDTLAVDFLMKLFGAPTRPTNSLPLQLAVRIARTSALTTVSSMSAAPAAFEPYIRLC